MPETPTACECPARNALKSVIAHLPHDTISHTFWDDDEGTVVYHDWFLAAKAALASPCPCEGRTSPHHVKITNSTGRVRYCEDCGARMKPGDTHDCPGPEETR